MPNINKLTAQKVVILVGPTASGKTASALRLAEKFPSEIINADSMQVYRYMDIGTSKPTASQTEKVPHHLLSIINPDEPFSAADYMKLGRKTIEDISERNKIPIVAGGTGLYIKSLTKGLFYSPGSDKDFRKSMAEESLEHLFEKLKKIDPIQAQRINHSDRHRIIRALEVFHLTGRTISSLHSEHDFSDTPYDCLKIGLYLDRDVLYRKIDLRVDEMIAQGFIEEVKKLLNMGYSPELKPMQSIGYLQLIQYIKGSLSLDRAIYCAKQQTRRYAKRQITWFRNDPEIIWFRADESFNLLETQVKNFLNNS